MKVKKPPTATKMNWDTRVDCQARRGEARRAGVSGVRWVGGSVGLCAMCSAVRCGAVRCGEVRRGAARWADLELVVHEALHNQL